MTAEKEINEALDPTELKLKKAPREDESFTVSRHDDKQGIVNLDPQRDFNKAEAAEAAFEPEESYLPPFVRQERTGFGVMYIFSVPQHMHIEGFAAEIPLGMADKSHPQVGQIAQKAWEMYGTLQNKMRLKELAELQEKPKEGTINDVLKEYREERLHEQIQAKGLKEEPYNLTAYLAGEGTLARDEQYKELQELGAQDPQKQIAEYHQGDVFALLRAQDGADEVERRRIHHEMSEFFAFANRKGYTNRNIVEDVNIHQTNTVDPAIKPLKNEYAFKPQEPETESDDAPTLEPF